MGLDGSNLILFQESQDRLDIHLNPKLESSAGSRATNITLDEEDPVLPEVVKMTLIVPRGGFEGASLRRSKPVCSVRLLE